MLQLINAARADAGLPPVQLGAHPAAQAHAEAMSAGCFSGHWSLDGLDAHMRYTLAGGQQASAENTSGPYLCGQWPPRPITTAIRTAMDGWMASPRHREGMLDPLHRVVSIGIAGTPTSAFSMVQLWEGEYIT